ncbi:Ig-like domain-containing protein [Pseudescherichia sp.]|uniref:Ig-like domain-containing protein n=1 Tax=Pseudescherichia sp. TaxID=2055881 RepID=UPI0028AA7229|nr:Ig-like domain-containing protein [Pseudescherichia sp.]
MVATSYTETDENGVASVILVSDTPGDAQVQVSTEGGQRARYKVSFYEFLVLFLQARGCAIADGQDAVNLLAFVQNSAREPLMGERVEWSTNHGQLSTSTSTTDADGTSLITITSTEPGPARIIANVRGNTISHLLKFYEDEITNCN